MTIEEKRKKIDRFCMAQSDCDKCPHDDNEFCMEYNHRAAPEDIIEKWYELFFGVEPTPAADEPHIRDSGSRTEFSTGAVRDIQKGKGRCDLMPLDVVAKMLGGVHDGTVSDAIMNDIFLFQQTGDVKHLYYAIRIFTQIRCGCVCTILLEVSKHFEEGAEKYGENNWQKGLPVKCYINSAVRHYLKWLRGDNDEPHDRAFCWNVICAIWTSTHKPELNDYGLKSCPVCDEPLPREAKFCDNCMVSQDFDPDSLMGEYEEENV